MKVVLLGSTGLVGKNVMRLLAGLDEVTQVYCPVRTVPILGAFGILKGASKFQFETMNFECLMENLDEQRRAGVKVRGYDAMICCLGTTLKQAKSKVGQERIDLRLPLTFAAFAKKQGIGHFLCVSAMGANARSPFFYNRLKGMLENGLTLLNFECLTLVRPSLLLGTHTDKRFGEELLQKIFGKHSAWIPERVRPVYAETVAAHLVTSLLKPPKDHVCATDGVKGKRIIYNRILAQTKVDELF